MPGAKACESAFTLVEVLIALLLIGIVAAFSIPKLLQVINNGERNAKMQESIALLYQIMEEGRSQDTLRPATFQDFFMSRINAVKTCEHAINDGCHPGSVTHASEFNQPSVSLASGVLITGFDNCCESALALPGEYWNAVIIDYNGTAPPNAWGQDQLRLNMCYGTAPCRSVSIARPACVDTTYPAPLPQKAGTITGHQGVGLCSTLPQAYVDNLALFDSVGVGN